MFRSFRNVLVIATALNLSACGGGGSSTPAPISPPGSSNASPTVDNETFSVVDAQQLEITLSGNDSDGQIASCSVSSSPANGTLSGTSPNFTYSNEGFIGTTEFTYTCTDNVGAISNTGTITIDVSSPPSGFFIDAVVRGLRYTSESIDGVTDESGEYAYLPGETISFYVGDILIGQSLPETFITPVSFSADATNPAAAGNIAQFLQSLDNDQNPDNGIFIEDATIEALTGKGLTINFDQSEADFQMDANVSEALLLLDARPDLLPREKTDKHLNSSIAVLPTKEIVSNLLASTYFGGRSLDRYHGSILSSPSTNEFNYIYGSTTLFENNPSDLPIPSSETYSAGSVFVVVLNSDLTELHSSSILESFNNPVLYDQGLATVKDMDEIIVYSDNLSNQITTIYPVCQNVTTPDIFGSIQQIFSDNDTLIALCFEENTVENTTNFSLKSFNENFEEISRVSLQFGLVNELTTTNVSQVLLASDGQIYVLGSSLNEDLGKSQTIVTRHSSGGSFLSGVIFGSAHELASERVAGIKQSSSGEIIIAGTAFFGDSSQNNAGVDAGFPQPSEGAVKGNFDNVRDGFIGIFDADLSELTRFTFVGGDDFVDNIDAFDIDPSGNIHVAGFTLSDDIPTTDNAIQTTVGSNSSFYTKISPELNEIIYSTYFGEFQTRIESLSVAADGSVFMAGPTTDDNLPLTGDPTFDGELESPFDPDVFNEDLFVSRIWPFEIQQ